ncbi:hypothetical protein PIB30_080003 [Stylosanthes scabra]|uniref:Uncharacterized protein n=1 Tax=Stylosanthes scabra TaxID=79078 RepID=A0ABU6QSL5_9FABA|nr:hypothetical protein [Stylosanthes scabra]
MSSNGKPSSFSHSITSHTQGNPSPRTTSSVSPIRKDTRDQQATEHWRRLWGYSQWADQSPSRSRQTPIPLQEQTNTNPPPGTGGMNAPPKTPNQPRNIGGWEMNDGQEASVTPEREILNLDGDQEGLEIGNSRRRVFVGLGDDQSRQTQEMRHWMRSVEDRLAQNFSRKRGRFRSRSRTRDSQSPSSRERHPQRSSRSRERRRSPTPRRRRSHSPGRRRSPTPRRSRTPDYRDDGWEQGIVGRRPFAPHIL